MLKAIKGGKMARWVDKDGIPHSAAESYRDHEDHLTAAVFARLSYLPTDVLWSVLFKAIDGARSSQTLRNRPRLDEVIFWPRFALEDEQSREIEPDVLLSFETFDVLVEAKRRDGAEPQTLKQVQDQIDAYHIQNREKPVYVLLVSGQLVGDFAELNGHADLLQTTWLEIRRAISQTEDEASGKLDQGHWLRALLDIEEALNLHGVRPRYTVEDLTLDLLSRIRTLQSDRVLWTTQRITRDGEDAAQ